eukprot:SAG25_NODE_2430_length_1615_cov_1.821240_2_plen_53_part_00
MWRQVSFYQVLALLLDLDVPWPEYLRSWMIVVSFLNVNLELAKPECQCIQNF